MLASAILRLRWLHGVAIGRARGRGHRRRPRLAPGRRAASRRASRSRRSLDARPESGDRAGRRGSASRGGRRRRSATAPRSLVGTRPAPRHGPALRRRPTAASRTIDCDLVAIAAAAGAGRSRCSRRTACDRAGTSASATSCPGDPTPGVHAAGHVSGRCRTTWSLAQGVLVGRAAGRGRRAAARTTAPPTQLASATRRPSRPRSRALPAAPGRLQAPGGRKQFVCVCEDVTVKELQQGVEGRLRQPRAHEALQHGHDGPVPGQDVPRPRRRGSTRRLTGATPGADRPDHRPPAVPAGHPGRAGRPAPRAASGAPRCTSATQALGATWTDMGDWKRPLHYGDVAAECRAVHEAAGHHRRLARSGKLDVQGADAGEFLDWLHPNRFSDLKVGRVRYRAMLDDAGIILDDGTVARLGAGALLRLDDDRQPRRRRPVAAAGGSRAASGDVGVTDVTGQYAAVNLAGPRAREIMAPRDRARRLPRGMPYLAAVEGDVAGVPAIILRIGFVGEVGYEIHVPADYGAHLWDALHGRRARTSACGRSAWRRSASCGSRSSTRSSARTRTPCRTRSRPAWAGSSRPTSPTSSAATPPWPWRRAAAPGPDGLRDRRRPTCPPRARRSCATAARRSAASRAPSGAPRSSTASRSGWLDAAEADGGHDGHDPARRRQGRRHDRRPGADEAVLRPDRRASCAHERRRPRPSGVRALEAVHRHRRGIGDAAAGRCPTATSTAERRAVTEAVGLAEPGLYDKWLLRGPGALGGVPRGRPGGRARVRHAGAGRAASTSGPSPTTRSGSSAYAPTPGGPPIAAVDFGPIARRRRAAAGVAATDVSSGWTVLRLARPDVRALLEELVAEDLSPAAFADLADRRRSRSRGCRVILSPPRRRRHPGFTLLVGPRRGRVPLGRLHRHRRPARHPAGRRRGAHRPRRRPPPCAARAERRDDRAAPADPDRAPDAAEAVATTSSSSAAACTAWPRRTSSRSAACSNVAVLERAYLGSGAIDAQHGDHPLQLPDRPGRRVLRRVGEALRAAVGGARLQRAVQPARPPDASPTPSSRSPACASAPRRTSSWASTRRSSSPTRSAKLAPALDLSKRPRFPIHAALWHPPGGIIRHDAVVWGYARRAERDGHRDPPVHRGHRHRRRRRARRPASRRRAARSARASSSTRRPAGRRRSRRWSACGSRS